jgi:cytochrome P450
MSYFSYKTNYLIIFPPDVQTKAHAELDAVIGDGRLPGFSDLPHLPYINAIVTEVLRWNSVAPTGVNFPYPALSNDFLPNRLGVPHMASEDGFIDGYYIPKGSLILTNLWYVRF